ncbi:MAG: hypothetical protein OXC02_07830 [Rhodobacteraceae bacterium]|nr:hypothetical protein [Paracoccaceae bacterium]
MVDSTTATVPRQRNSRDENNEVKNGRIPSDWEENENQLQQKDTDDRWAKKHGQKGKARQIVLNKAYSWTRCCVEHVFGSMHNDMPEQVMRWVEDVRTTCIMWSCQ